MQNSSLWIVLQRMRLPFTVIVITYTISITGLVLIPGVDNEGNPYNLSIFDAFYFTSYMATTIGFGESPYDFTYAQKIWVSISIYLTVLGWFYGIGTLVSLLQDKLFLSEIAIVRFKRAVKNIKEDFVIVLGYNDTTSEIINKMLEKKIRVVVIEKEQSKADYLMLEGFIPHVPVLVGDVENIKSLEYAGIYSKHCKAIISLFQANILNLRVTLASKLLNPAVKVAIKATTTDDTLNLLDAGADIVENPYAIITYQIEMGLNSPSLFKLENWLYQIDTLECKKFSIPKDNIIICGYGRLGKLLDNMFKKNDIIPTVIEKNEEVYEKAKKNDFIENIILGNAEDKYTLRKANIETAKLIIVATENDTINLSIISTIKKLNKKIFIISRENQISNLSIFTYANINYIFLPSKIIIHKSINAIVNPLNDRLIRLITRKDEKWGQALLAKLLKTIHSNPITFELEITPKDAPEIYNYLKIENKKISLAMMKRSRRDKTQHNNIVTLLIVRNNKDIILPDDSTELKRYDKILFACDNNAKDDLEYIANNIYELSYILGYKKEKNFMGLFK